MDITRLHIGRAVRIRTNNDIYDSYISAITLTDENFVYFKTGSLRTTIVDKLKANKSEIGNKLDISGGKITGDLSVEKQIYIGDNKVLAFHNGNLEDANGNKYYLNIEDTGWINATISSNFKVYNNNTWNTVQYRKNGKTVSIRGVISPTQEIAAGVDLNIFTLPTGYIPSRSITKLCQGSGKSNWLLTVDFNGAVNFGRYGTNTNTATPTSAWLPFEVTFLID